MRTVHTVILSGLLILAVIGGGVLYHRMAKKADELAAAEKTISAQKERISTLVKETKTLSTTKTDVSKSLDTARTRIEELTTQIQKDKRRHEASQKTISRLEQEKAALTATLSEKDGILTSLKRRLEDGSAQNDRLRAEIAATEKALEGLRKQVGSCIAELEKCGRERASQQAAHEKERVAAQQRINALETRFQEKDAALTAAEEKLARLNREKDDLIARLSKKNRETTSLEKETAMLRVRLVEKDETLAALRTQLEDTKRQMAGMKTRLNDETATVEMLRDRMETAREKIAALEKEIEDLKDRVAELQWKLTDLAQGREQASETIETLKSTYDAMRRRLKAQIEKKEVVIERLKETLSVSFVDKILFDFAKASINFKGKRLLKDVVEILKETRAGKIIVVGHTDNVPIHGGYRYKYPTNWELSTARASSVVRFLQRNGIDPKRMQAAGKSYYSPVAGNETSEGRAQNRRVEIILAPWAVDATGN